MVIASLAQMREHALEQLYPEERVTAQADAVAGMFWGLQPPSVVTVTDQRLLIVGVPLNPYRRWRGTAYTLWTRNLSDLGNMRLRSQVPESGTGAKALSFNFKDRASRGYYTFQAESDAQSIFKAMGDGCR